MKKSIEKLTFVCIFVSFFCISCTQRAVTGELKQWHKVTVMFDGSDTSETATSNPFTDYRLNVTFTAPSGQQYVVPGYYAADGNAANTGADSGGKWRAHLAPDEAGKWKYQASFRTGKMIAVADDLEAGKAVSAIDGKKGSFVIKPTDKSGRDFRGQGRLQYVGKHHLRFAGSGEYFLKCGPDAPETFLAYKDFDGTETKKKNAPLKTWQPHVKDYNPGDPTWMNGKGKGIVGAINYLSDKGANSVSFLTYNAGGDGDNVWPFRDRDDKFRYDCSKLDQWQIVFDHAQAKGLYLHFKMQETENDDNRMSNTDVVVESLDGGDLGPERKLYFRELIARFGYSLALNWNLGEENTQSTQQQRAMTAYFRQHDPYRHLVVIHTHPGEHDKVYSPLLGDKSDLTGASLQNDWQQTHQKTLQWVTASKQAGKPWVVANDEQGPADKGAVPDTGYQGFAPKTAGYGMYDIRKQVLWGNLMAGGAGVEYYFGYSLPENDLVCEDFRSRDKSWDYGRIALEFFKKQNIPFWDMVSKDDLTWQKDDYCFVKEGQIYLIYQKEGKDLNFDLSEGQFECGYLDPRTGAGTDKLLGQEMIDGPAKYTFKAPDNQDWLCVIRSKNGGTIKSSNRGRVFKKAKGLLEVEAEDFAKQEKTDKRKWYITNAESVPDIQPDGDPSHAANASGGAYIEILPDTRRTHDDPLISGASFSNEPGRMAVLSYPVHIDTPGRYYVWVRTYSTGTEDNGLHVGIDGTWPESGARLQWCAGKNSWWWESKQRTDANHCGEPHKIYLDIEKAGPHIIQFSMREDGFEFDKFILTTNKEN
ncbi:MAG: DUF5060 domain-containing protein [Planctomycetes bacterium]|nr:DUF5060 domain-containing protein [Planctomycetota bacterium]